MIDNTGELEFEVMGLMVKFRPKEGEENKPVEVIEYLKREANDIRIKKPNVTNEQLAILVALKSAEELVQLREEYRDSINRLHLTAKEILGSNS